MDILKSQKFREIIDTFGIGLTDQLLKNILALAKLDLQQAISSTNVQEKMVRQGRTLTQKMCNFCKRNGDPRPFYTAHNLRENGKVTCPILQQHTCELCGATGFEAHTR